LFWRFQLLDRDNKELMKRVADAMKGGHYPSPSDAKAVVDQLHRAHLNKRRKKLEVVYTDLCCSRFTPSQATYSGGY